MGKCMGKENFNGKMVRLMRDNINLAKNRGLADLFLLLKTIIKVVGWMANKMGKEFYLIRMVCNSKEDFGSKEFFKAKIIYNEFKNIKTDNDHEFWIILKFLSIAFVFCLKERMFVFWTVFSIF